MKTECRQSDGKLVYHQIWNLNGNEELINGTGEHNFEHDERKAIEHFVIMDSIVVEHFDFRTEKKDTIYWICDEPAIYKGGLEMAYRTWRIYQKQRPVVR